MSTATEVRLLTLLNVSAVKRPRDLDAPGGHRSPSIQASPIQSGLKGLPNGNGEEKVDGPSVKRRKSVVFGGIVGPSGSGVGKKGKGKGKGKQVNPEDVPVQSNGHGHGVTKPVEVEPELDEEIDSDDDDAGPSSTGNDDLFNIHFGPEPPLLTSENISAADENHWDVERTVLKGFGRVVEARPGKGSSLVEDVKTRLSPALLASMKMASTSALVSTALSHLGTYKDFYLHSLDGEADGSEKTIYGEQKEAIRQAVVAHALNHVLKTRRKIIRNNEKLAHASSLNPESVPDPPRDQSFTRPKVLIILPLRSLALRYLTLHLFPLAPAGTQIENLRPFTSSFSIPADTEDPLASSSAASNFAIDHLANFRGNSDDNFRFGIKITRKAWRVVMMPANEAKLMECDILVASPLAVKMLAEKEGSTDLLSSIEICVADGVDVMQMQNWEHTQFIFQNLNKIPDSPHGCDFSRVKPWYLESQARYLRQTILLSRYDTPETRALFSRHCHNLQGKVRSDRSDFAGVLGRVRPGVKQIFERVDLEGGKGTSGDAAIDEVDQRLEWFTKKTIPALLRSAVSRQNTIIIIPSYFDFVRVTNHLRKADEVSFAAISEYSSNSEISKARTLFFKGKKSFLIVTERFHFYRRYRLRGAKTIVFYALPDHAQFYAEFLHTPFLPPQNKTGEEVEVDEGEISSRVLFSRFDVLKLERVVGSADARRMLGSGEGRFEFI
ncbi:hypothetical protein BCR39DRAFT_511920 [Naematelia encephala]|uniref:U3 small nucleolar RNA-associated protein 25 n=1 Tax=Naematelia encephala TaxID=71784 RepID=A0A1Y2BM00_9TREE|nr:hypothetical protein BCR39DRAFT_511920 [Naematelia encephala]